MVSPLFVKIAVQMARPVCPTVQFRS